MRLLFTTSDRIGAEAIRWGLGEPCSHVVIHFDGPYGIVMHSHYEGVGIAWYDDFIKTNKIVHALDTQTSLPLETEEQIYQTMMKSRYGLKYDYWAFAYFSLRVIMLKLFGVPLPEKNYLDSRNSYLCVGLYQKLHEIAPYLFPAPYKDVEMMSPEEVYRLAKTSQYLKDCE